MVMSLIVMDSDGSRRLRAVNNLRCFTGRFTDLSDSELPDSTVTGVTYHSLRNLIRLREQFGVHMWGGSLVESMGLLLN